jgi:pSer/pThr/pTyr-binding forkhead associated (FHA) protein
MALNVTLVVVGGDVKTPEVKLRLPSTVGRGRDCSIMLRHPLVSRQHCELFEAGGGLMVRDLGSLNGTFVNNLRIEGDSPLQPGQLLTVGTVTFRAMYEAGDVDSAPPTTPAPKMKTTTPSSETDMDGTLTQRPPPIDTSATQIGGSDSDTLEPEEPVEIDMDFDLNDAKPLFSESPAPQKPTAQKTVPQPKKNTGSSETVHAGMKTKPPASPPAPAGAATKPAAPAQSAPAAKPAAAPATEKQAAKTAPAKSQEDAASFGFLNADDETPKGGEDDDDLNDFLKNLK